jgi:predicted  nucleic acid-binding Zn-ribbon protein
MSRICTSCGFEYIQESDFESGKGRCWQCAARAYKHGLTRITKERDEARAVVETYDQRFADHHDEHRAEEERLRRERDEARTALNEIDADLVALTNSGGLESLSSDHLALLMRAHAFARWQKQPEWDERVRAVRNSATGNKQP